MHTSDGALSAATGLRHEALQACAAHFSALLQEFSAAPSTAALTQQVRVLPPAELCETRDGRIHGTPAHELARVAGELFCALRWRNTSTRPVDLPAIKTTSNGTLHSLLGSDACGSPAGVLGRGEPWEHHKRCAVSLSAPAFIALPSKHVGCMWPSCHSFPTSPAS